MIRTRNPLRDCPKGQVMRGIVKGIKHLPSRLSDRSALNNRHNRKLQDYARLTRSEKENVQIGNIGVILIHKICITWPNNFGKVGDWHVWKYGPQRQYANPEAPKQPTGYAYVNPPPPLWPKPPNLGYGAKPRSPYSSATMKCKQIIHKNPQTAQGVSLRQERQRINQFGSRKAVYFGKDP